MWLVKFSSDSARKRAGESKRRGEEGATQTTFSRRSYLWVVTLVQWDHPRMELLCNLRSGCVMLVSVVEWDEHQLPYFFIKGQEVCLVHTRGLAWPITLLSCCFFHSTNVICSDGHQGDNRRGGVIRKEGGLVSCSCSNKLPQTWRLRTIKNHSFPVLEARSLKSGCPQGCACSEGSRGRSFLTSSGFSVSSVST